MAVYDLGDVVPLGITLTDANNAVVNATAVTCTIYLPDGTNVSGSVVNAATGTYNCDFTPTLVGRYAVKWVATGSNASAYSDDFTVRDFSQIGIVGLDEVKAFLDIPSATVNDDVQIRQFMDTATELAENYTGVILGQRTYTSELYDGGIEFIRIRHPRIISITSVYENGVVVDPSAYSFDYTGQRLFRVGSDTLYAVSSYGYWSPGFNNVSISYVAGYANPPASAKQGVLEIIRHLWMSQRGSMNVMSRSTTGDDLYTTPTYSLPRRAMELLDPIKLPGVA